MSVAEISLVGFNGAFGGYLASLIFSLMKKKQAAGIFFIAGLVLHTVSQITRGWYLSFFFPHPIFNEISFLPWSLGCVGLFTRFFKQDIRLFPHVIIPVLFFSFITLCFTLFYPQKVAPPFVQQQTFFSPLFFAFEALAHACFIMGGWLAFFFLHNESETPNYHGFVIWGFVLYSLAQIFGAVWAYLGWGSPFHWADKHLASAAIWCFYAAYIHLSFVARWDVRKKAAVALIGVFPVLLFTFDYQLTELMRMTGGGYA